MNTATDTTSQNSQPAIQVDLKALKARKLNLARTDPCEPVVEAAVTRIHAANLTRCSRACRRVRRHETTYAAGSQVRSGRCGSVGHAPLRRATVSGSDHAVATGFSPLPPSRTKCGATPLLKRPLRVERAGIEPATSGLQSRENGWTAENEQRREMPNLAWMQGSRRFVPHGSTGRFRALLA